MHVKTVRNVLRAALLCAMLAAAAAGRAAGAAGEMQVTFLDVGQGDAVYVRTPGGKHLLIDGGPADGQRGGTTGDAGRDAVLPFLQRHGVFRLDAVILTHSHPDHAGGLRAVLLGVDADALYITGHDSGDPEYRELLALAVDHRIPTRKIRAGDAITLDPALDVRVLGPGRRTRNFKSFNDASAVIRMAYGDVSFLFAGDAERGAEQRLIRECGPGLRSTVLKVGHHGSSSSTTRPFLQRVAPEVAVISCAFDNDYGHPHVQTLVSLKARKVKVFRTDYHGNVTVTTDGRRYAVATQKRE